MIVPNIGAVSYFDLFQSLGFEPAILRRRDVASASGRTCLRERACQVRRWSKDVTMFYAVRLRTAGVEAARLH
jgi:hypothetical protein